MLDNGARFFFQGQVRGKNAAYRWVELTGQLERGANSSPYRVLGTVQDITERKLAEQANGLIAAIVDSSGDAIISKSLDGIITSWNNAAEKLFGHTAEEAIANHIFLIIPPDRRDEEAKIVERLKRGERIEQFETRRMRKDGTLLDLS